jgi:hypothetical protein
MALKSANLIEYLDSVSNKKVISFYAEMPGRHPHGDTVGVLKRFYLLPSKTKGKKTFYAKCRKGSIRRFFSGARIWVQVKT